jgi:hypothetical protein
MAFTVGIAFTVNILVTCDVQPKPLVTAYVIIVVPAATPDTTPPVPIVATDVFEEDQLPPVVGLDNVADALAQTDVTPVIPNTPGTGLTVTTLVTLVTQPNELVTV